MLVMKSFVVLLGTFLALLDPVAAAGCLSEEPRNATYFTALYDSLKAEPNSIRRQSDLEASFNDSNKGFSSNQTIALLGLFQNSFTISELITELSPIILGFYCADVVVLLQSILSPNTQLDIVKATVNHTIDLALNNATLLTVFDFPNYRDEARVVIDNAVAQSCVFGDVSPSRLIFLVDCSGSMATTFVTDDGRTVTRIGFVAEQLRGVVSKQLNTDQEFNLITFPGGKWNQGVVPVNDANIASAVAFISAFRASGSTPMLEGVTYAFSDPDAYAVYLLTDGVPDTGNSQIIAAAANYHASTDSHGTQRIVNAIAFLAGNYYPPAATFMNEVANVGGGFYRAFA